MFIVFGRDISRVRRMSEISLHKNNSYDLHRVITHSLVLVIILVGAVVPPTRYQLAMMLPMSVPLASEAP